MFLDIFMIRVVTSGALYRKSEKSADHNSFGTNTNKKVYELILRVQTLEVCRTSQIKEKGSRLLSPRQCF